MRVKATILAGLAVLALSSLAGCATTIPPGKVGIIVNKFGQNRGVQDYTATTGFVTYNPFSTDVIEYPTNVQTVQWTANKNEGAPQDESITFTTKESVSINADVSLSYQLETKLVPAFYVMFRNDDLNGFTYGYLHNVARDAMMEIGGHYTVEQIMGDNEKFLHEVRDRLQGQVAGIGVQIQQFGFIGSPRPPAQVVEAINAAQQAKYLAQQKQNELLSTQADVAKQVAAAEGLAKSNLILSSSITDKLLQKQTLDLQDRWIARWDGHTPTVTAGGSSGMLYTLPAAK